MIVFQTVNSCVPLYEGSSFDEAVRVAKTAPFDQVEIWVNDNSSILWSNEKTVADLSELLKVPIFIGSRNYGAHPEVHTRNC